MMEYNLESVALQSPYGAHVKGVNETRRVRVFLSHLCLCALLFWVFTECATWYVVM